jgi:hypothetical protein
MGRLVAEGRSTGSFHLYPNSIALRSVVGPGDPNDRHTETQLTQPASESVPLRSVWWPRGPLNHHTDTKPGFGISRKALQLHYPSFFAPFSHHLSSLSLSVTCTRQFSEGLSWPPLLSLHCLGQGKVRSKPLLPFFGG